MEFSHQELIQIVERASTLAERLEPQFQSRPAAEDAPPIKTRLEQWCQVAAQGFQSKFEQRLAWDGLDVATVSRTLGGVQWVDGLPLPAWTETLQAALRAAAEAGELGAEADERSIQAKLLDPEEPLPFEELLVPFINVARQRLINQAGSTYTLLTEAAHASLERSLLTRLAYTCAQAITLEFSIFRLLKQPEAIQPWLQSPGQPSGILYHSFVKEMLTGKLGPLFQKYPVLARLIATATDFWVEATAEFLQRLAADLAQIQQTFAATGELGQVIAVQPALSDPHDRGRSVIALQFASGLKLVYKPRNLGLEVNYFQLLAWLNEQGAPLPFKLLTILNRPAYGWVEYITPSPCQDEGEARRYYRRAGMLLALLYTLNATDCHFQNIIACSEQPVIIDVDMLITPGVNWPNRDNPDLEAQFLANRRLLDSVLRTGLAPRWEVGANQSIYDVSGLGAVGEQDMQELVPVWRNINQDDMAVGYQPGIIHSYANSPLSAGLNLATSVCDEELILGFQQMYCFLMARREALLASASPLAALAEQRPRFMLRNTRGYFQILQKSLQAKFLRDGADRSLQLDFLSRWMLSFGERPRFWPLLAFELQALAQLDIPYFAAPATSTVFSPAPGQTIEQLFNQSSYDRAVTRLKQLSQEDLAQQVEIIRASAYARLVSDPHQAGPKNEGERRQDEDGNFDPSFLITYPREGVHPSSLIQPAIDIARELRQRAIASTDGHSLVWLGLDYLPEVQRYQFQPLHYGFYGGNGGIALFLAALAQVTGDDDFRQLALRTLQPMRYGLSDLTSNKPGIDPTKALRATTLGGAQGLGSLFYVLAQTGQLLGERMLLAEAKQVAALITPELIAADAKFDVMLGAAGTILGLLALYRVTADPAILAQANACGQHLLAKRVASLTGHQLWPTLRGKFLTGFAHGAAGIAYALLRLDQALQENVRQKEESKAHFGLLNTADSVSSSLIPHPSAFLSAAQEAIAYEQSLFSAETGNWPDLRTEGEPPAFSAGWCHGAAGIGLARLGGLAGLDTPAVRRDIEAALQQAGQPTNLAGVDHLCCGNLGRLELLLVASRCLNRPDLLEVAQQQAAWILNRARQTASFRLFPDLAQPLYQPGFFRGTAGIGYQLLRLTHPDSLPSALLWN